MHKIADLFEDLFGEGLALPRNALVPGDVGRLEGMVRTGAAIILPTGEVLGGRFKISELIGVGTLGLVYTASDQRAGWKTVAVKAFHPGLGEGVKPRVEDAIRKLAGDHDPRVLSVIASGTHAGQYYVVMEHIPTNLERAMAETTLSTGDAFAVFDGVCEGLAFLHRRGLAHGDLKASNVLLRMSIDGGPEPVLADWGQLLDAEQGLTPDSLFHMPPEQVDDPYPDPTHDVYAAGVLLYQLLAGRHPFDLELATRLLDKYLSAAKALAEEKRRIMLELLPEDAEPPKPSGGAKVLAGAYREMIGAVPQLALPRRAGLRHRASTDLIIRKAMHHDPAFRYGSVAELQADLRRNRGGLALVGVKEPPQTRLLKWYLRNRDRLPYAIAGLLVLVVAMGVIVVRASLPGRIAVDVPDWVLDLTLRIDGEEISYLQLPSRSFGPGEVDVSVATPGWRTSAATVDVPARGEVSVGLVRERSKVSIVTEPAGARLELLSSPRDPDLPDIVTPFEGELPTGDYEASVRADGHLWAATSFEVVPGEALELKEALLPLVERRIPVPGAAAFLVDGARLITATSARGRAALEVRALGGGAEAGAVEVRLPAAVAGGMTLLDATGDGVADLVYSDARGNLVVRGGPAFEEVAWTARGAGSPWPAVLHGAVAAPAAEAAAEELAPGELPGRPAPPATELPVEDDRDLLPAPGELGGGGADPREEATPAASGRAERSPAASGGTKAASRPTPSGRVLIAMGADGVLRAFAARTGKPRWSTAALPPGVTGRKAGLPAGGPIVAHDGFAYVPSTDGGLYAVDVATGEVRWRAGRPAALTTAATWLELAPGDASILVGDADGSFALLDADAGIPVRIGRTEAAGAGAPLPVWHDGERWQTVRVEATGHARVEALRSGDGGPRLGRYDGDPRWVAVRRDGADEGDGGDEGDGDDDGGHLVILGFADAVHVVQLAGAGTAGRPLMTVAVALEAPPVLFSDEGGPLRAAWLDGDELLLARLAPADGGPAVAPASPGGAVLTLPREAPEPDLSRKP